MQIDSALISIWSPLIVEACDCVFYLRYRRSDTAANHLSTWALKTLNTVWFNLIYHSIMHLSIILLLGAFDVYRQNAFAVDWDKETNGGTSFLTIGARFKGLSSLGRVVVWKCFVFEWQGKKKQCVFYLEKYLFFLLSEGRSLMCMASRPKIRLALVDFHFLFTPSFVCV